MCFPQQLQRSLIHCRRLLQTKPDSSKRPKWNPKAVPDAPPVANASQVESSPEPTFSESSQASPEAAQTQVRKKWTPKKN